MNYTKYDMESYRIHTITTTRFKTIYFAVNFKRETKKEEITIRNFLNDILLNTTKKLPTLRDIEMKVEELYSLSASASSYISGNYDIISLTSTFLNEHYTEPGMNETTISFLMDFIWNPNVENGQFAKIPFDLEFQNLKNDLESIKDNPNRYSKIRLHEEMAPNLPLSYHGFGYLEDLSEITRENLYQYYQDVIKNDIVDIFIVGNFDSEEMKNLIAKYMKLKGIRKCVKEHFVEIETKQEKTIKESLPVIQSKLVIGLTSTNLTPFERKYVLNIYSFILGGSSDSKLFSNVREKNSLCYVISASPSMIYGTVEIIAGINTKTYDKTVNLIKETIETMKTDIKEEEVEKAIVTYLSGCKEVSDSQQAIVNNYLSHEYLDTDLLEIRKEKIKEVTKEDVMNLANKLTINTIYFLKGRDEDEA